MLSGKITGVRHSDGRLQLPVMERGYPAQYESELLDAMNPDVERSDAPTSLTRQQLYLLVWQKPISHPARAFGLSGHDLVKICDRFDIPRPAPGHWQKLAVGKVVETRALPPVPSGMAETISIVPIPRGRAAEPESERELATARDRTKALQVAERLVRPQERRRHRMLDALLKALEAQKIAVAESERLELFATSGRERIEFQLRTKLQQVRRPLTADERDWHSYRDRDHKLELAETDILIFEVKGWLPGGLRRNWQDGRKGTVETMAGDILATLLAAFPLMAVEREQREKAEERRRIEAQRRYELEQQRKLDENRFRCLLEHAGRWRDAELARGFVAALRAAIPDPTVIIDDQPVSEWLDWAEARASQHDPFASDPLDVFDTIADVTNWTYRDR